MRYYLDTNICIYFLKGMNGNLCQQLMEHHPDEIKISSIVKAELLYGAEKSIRREENLEKIEEFLFPFEIIPFDDQSVNAYGKIRSTLEKNGNIIGPNDLILAATVRSREGTLVTHNTKEFNRVDGLLVVDWAE